MGNFLVTPRKLKIFLGHLSVGHGTPMERLPSSYQRQKSMYSFGIQKHFPLKPTFVKKTK